MYFNQASSSTWSMFKNCNNNGMVPMLLYTASVSCSYVYDLDGIRQYFYGFSSEYMHALLLLSFIPKQEKNCTFDNSRVGKKIVSLQNYLFHHSLPSSASLLHPSRIAVSLLLECLHASRILTAPIWARVSYICAYLFNIARAWSLHQLDIGTTHVLFFTSLPSNEVIKKYLLEIPLCTNIFTT